MSTTDARVPERGSLMAGAVLTPHIRETMQIGCERSVVVVVMRSIRREVMANSWQNVP
jgi:hypothetical protein